MYKSGFSSKTKPVRCVCVFVYMCVYTTYVYIIYDRLCSYMFILCIYGERERFILRNWLTMIMEADECQLCGVGWQPGVPKKN